MKNIIPVAKTTICPICGIKTNEFAKHLKHSHKEEEIESAIEETTTVWSLREYFLLNNMRL